MFARKAALPDVDAIYGLIYDYSQSGTLLPRSIAELCENIRDFVVVEDETGIVGCGALHLYGTHLAEIRSIVVRRTEQGRGGGRVLIDALMDEAAHHGVTCVCLFTRIPEFFAHMGFSAAHREELPDKIYKDCMNCPKLHACDEVAMVRGELPSFAILAQPEQALVKLRI